MASLWRVRREGAIAIVTYDRPPDNQMSFAALAELDGVLDDISRDEAVALVVLTGGVPGYFVAHADLCDVGRMTRGEHAGEGPERWHWTLLRIESMPQPVVAAVDGQAHGGGCELALACMLRIGSPAAHFCQLELRHGAIPGAGGTQRLPRLIGPSRAAQIILSGRIVEAREALALGLLDAIVDDGDFLTGALRWCEPIAAQPRAALLAAKHAIVAGLRMPLYEGLDLERRLFAELLRANHAAPIPEERES